MRKFVFIIVAVVALMWGCNSKNETAMKVQNIEVDVNMQNQASTRAAFESFDYVKLEMTSESLIPDVAKVIANDTRIYVLSMRGEVFVFSREGKYINKLNRGKGPGEILFVSDISVVDDELYVLDNYRTIRKYNSDGSFIEVIEALEEPFFSMAYEGEKLLLFDPHINKRSDFMLRMISKEKTTNLLPKKETVKTLSFLYYNFYNKGYLSYPLSDTIYHYVDSTDIVPKYHIQFKGKNYYEKINADKYTMEEFCELNQDKSYYRWLRDVVPYNSGFYFSFSYDQTYFARFENGSLSIYSKLVNGLPVPEQMAMAVGFTDTEIIYAYMPEELKDYLSREENKIGSMEKTLYDSLKDDDNPVLVFLKLKE